MAKKKKKRRLKIKKILICMIIMLLIGYISYYILMMPINNIYISGNNIVSESEIISLANLESYPSFLLTFSNKVKQNIKKNKYIENVIISKKIGNKLYIKIEEFKVLCILNDDKILLSNGKILDNIYNLTDIPLLINNIDDKKILKYFIKKFSKVDYHILRQISQIEYNPVNVDSERFLLYMDDGNEVYITLTKIDKLNKYNEIVEKMDGSQGIIYLDSGDYIEVKNATQVIDTISNDDNNNENITTNESDNEYTENITNDLNNGT